jgi:hypothetical protein
MRKTENNELDDSFTKNENRLDSLNLKNLRTETGTYGKNKFNSCPTPVKTKS